MQSPSVPTTAAASAPLLCIAQTMSVARLSSPGLFCARSSMRGWKGRAAAATTACRAAAMQSLLAQTTAAATELLLHTMYCDTSAPLSMPQQLERTLAHGSTFGHWQVHGTFWGRQIAITSRGPDVPSKCRTSLEWLSCVSINIVQPGRPEDPMLQTMAPAGPAKPLTPGKKRPAWGVGRGGHTAGGTRGAIQASSRLTPSRATSRNRTEIAETAKRGKVDRALCSVAH